MTASLLCALLHEETDRKRVEVWVQCGFNCARAARLRPDLGAERTYQLTIERYEAAIGQVVLCAIAEDRKG